MYLLFLNYVPVDDAEKLVLRKTGLHIQWSEHVLFWMCTGRTKLAMKMVARLTELTPPYKHRACPICISGLNGLAPAYKRCKCYIHVPGMSVHMYNSV